MPSIGMLVLNMCVSAWDALGKEFCAWDALFLKVHSVWDTLGEVVGYQTYSVQYLLSTSWYVGGTTVRWSFMSAIPD